MIRKYHNHKLQTTPWPCTLILNSSIHCYRYHWAKISWMNSKYRLILLNLRNPSNIYASWSTSELRVRLAPLNRFKPSSKIFYWPFQGGTSFVDLLCFCSVLCLLCLCMRLFICALWSPSGKGLTSWLRLFVFFLFDLILYVPSTIFQLYRDGSSWVEPVLK